MLTRFLSSASAWFTGLFLLCLVQFPVAAQSPAQDPIDFGAILESAYLASAAYQSEAEVRQSVQLANYTLTDYQVIPEIQLSYFVMTNDLTQRQIISVRGTSNVENTLVDISVKLTQDQYTGLYLHEGFAFAARQVFLRVRSKLKRGYVINTTGHSLGGAVALILAKYLETDQFNIGQVITFGQPKVTNIAGSKVLQSLNVIRVVTPLDLVPLVPPFDPMDIANANLNIYWHTGKEVLLLDGNRYAILEGLQSMLRATKFTQQRLTEQSLNNHKMLFYIQMLKDKTRAAEQVPFETSLNLFNLFGS